MYFIAFLFVLQQPTAEQLRYAQLLSSGDDSNKFQESIKQVGSSDLVLRLGMLSLFCIVYLMYIAVPYEESVVFV